MPIRELAEHPLGVTWVMKESMLRASHALAHDGRVWLVDPVDEPEAMERVAALGEPVGVMQLFAAHNRDGEALAKRLGVPFHRLPDLLPDSPFSVLNIDMGFWKERALWWPELRGLVVPESIGTGPAAAVGPGPAGVHPFRRPLPPISLKTFLPEHLLVGHGGPLHGSDATAGLLDALNRSRRDIPTFFIKLPGIIRRIRSAG
jgi:hypothetical protein